MARADRIVRSYLRDRFVVTLKNGDAVDGMLLDADQTSFILGDATFFHGSDKWKADGTLFVARADVAYMQLPRVGA